MLFKVGVVAGPPWLLAPPIMHLIAHDGVLDRACMEAFGEPCRVTSVLEGVHSRKSHHQWGRAIDIGVKPWPYGAKMFTIAQMHRCAELVRQYIDEDPNLPPASEFDIVVESNHIHLEWDPK